MSENPDVIGALQRTKDRLTDPNDWIKAYTALDHNGESVYVKDPNACKWCLCGALCWASEESTQYYVLEAVADVLREIYKIPPFIYYEHHHLIWRFNEDRATRHADVLNLLDRVIG